MNTIGMLITTFKRNVTSHLRGCPSGKILTNYTSEESLINYTVQVCFPFSKRHQPVRSETTEGSPIEFERIYRVCRFDRFS